MLMEANTQETTDRLDKLRLKRFGAGIKQQAVAWEMDMLPPMFNRMELGNYPAPDDFVARYTVALDKLIAQKERDACR